MKKCIDCLLEKNITEFYAHSKMKDGHLNKCKDCVRARIENHRIKNINFIREYDRKRGRTLERLEKNKLHSRKVRAENRSGAAKWMRLNPEKKAAHLLVQRAVNKGRLIKKPCEVCGKKKVEGHHNDYMKPLEVRWLCRKHHAELHRKYKD